MSTVLVIYCIWFQLLFIATTEAVLLLKGTVGNGQLCLLEMKLSSLFINKMKKCQFTLLASPKYKTAKKEVSLHDFLP